MSRRTDALRAMAEQTESPEEAAIAQAKLVAEEAREARRHPELVTYEQRMAAEAERQRLADEAIRAAIVRRWEQGEFAGIRVTTGATTKIRYQR